MPQSIFARAESRDFPTELSLQEAAQWMTASYVHPFGGTESEEVEVRLYAAVKDGLLKFSRSEEVQVTPMPLMAVFSARNFFGGSNSGRQQAPCQSEAMSKTTLSGTIYYVTPEQLSVMAVHEKPLGCWGECVQALAAQANPDTDVEQETLTPFTTPMPSLEMPDFEITKERAEEIFLEEWPEHAKDLERPGNHDYLTWAGGGARKGYYWNDRLKAACSKKHGPGLSEKRKLTGSEVTQWGSTIAQLQAANK